jgi:predicted metal-binding membrane protein
MRSHVIDVRNANAGGWTMSMMWMLMPGQTWLSAAASFVGMWTVMMVAMMLPSLMPMLRRYRETVARSETTRLGRLTIVVALAYFSVWAGSGAVIFPFGLALAMLEMQQPALARAVPLAMGVTVLIAGALQLTAWKARRLQCCRGTFERKRALAAGHATAWMHGLRLGFQCVSCCAGLTLALLVLGVMDLRVMAAATLAITLERLAPAGLRLARAIGAVLVVTGSYMVAAAIGVA